MRNLKLIIILLSIFSDVFGQDTIFEQTLNDIRHNCCAKNKVMSGFGRSAVLKDSFLIDEIIKEKKNSPFKNFISNRKDLKQLVTVIGTENLVIISDSLNNDVTFRARTQFTKLSGFKNVKIDTLAISAIDNIKIVSSINGKSQYGFANVIDSVKHFEFLRININGVNIKIPEEAYDDLFFPNINETRLAIKPIQVFESENGQFYYVYIFGLYESYHDPELTTKPISYMCKLIFDKNRYIGRLVSDLTGYDWKFCRNFIGF